MFNINYDDIIKKIKEVKGLSENEIESKINDKLEKLSGLISKEGAAHIIANELGVKIFENVSEKKLKINDLLVGMRSVRINGKVVQVYDIREFKTENREGRIGSFLIGDESGSIRVVVWDSSLIDKISDLKENDIVRIRDAYVRDNNRFLELHLNNRSSIEINPKDVNIEVSVVKNIQNSYNKKEIKNLKEGDSNVGIFGTIVQVFEPRFFEVCSECGKRMKLNVTNFVCDDHKNSNVKYVPVLNLFLDDGSDNIRSVAFRDQAYEILSLDEEKVLALKDNLKDFENIRRNILGEQLLLIGRVTKNEMFNRLEFVVNNVEKKSADEIIEEMKISD